MAMAMGAAGAAAAGCCPCCLAPSSSSASSCSSDSFSRHQRLSMPLPSTAAAGLLAHSQVRDERTRPAAPLMCALEAGPSGRGIRRVQATPYGVAERSSGAAAGQLEEGVVERVAEDADVSAITEWELDFCSRPILDARGKKVWELVVCDSKRQLEFTRYFPSNVINSVTLRDTLSYIMGNLGVPRPLKVRFFRSQMQTIISKACTELDIQPVPSQRCITLVRWLAERNDTVYRLHPGYNESAAPLVLLEEPLPQDLPDTLRGEQWAFVQLPLSGVLEEMASVELGSTFGKIFDMNVLGLDLPPDAVIPGVAVASARATPLAAWTNALELSSIVVDKQRACLILSTGVADRWGYAYYRRSKQADQEAEAWEAAKRDCSGLHFLAVQQSLDSDVCTGFWLMIEGCRSPV